MTIRGKHAYYRRQVQCLRVLSSARAGEADRYSPEAGCTGPTGASTSGATQQRAAEVDVIVDLWVGVG